MAHNYRRKFAYDDDSSNMDYEELDAMEWRQPSHENPGKKAIDYSAPLNIPNAVWIIPSHFTQNDILGEKNTHLTRISQYTSASMVYNKAEHRIEMWGDDLEEAIHQWDSLAENILEERRKKSKKWGKPEKAPTTKKQKEKFKRRKDREDEEKTYRSIPRSKYFPYFGYFVINTEISIAQFIGSSSELLNPLRIETKCHIWPEPKLSLDSLDITIKVAGDSRESVEEATTRVKNIFVKVLASRTIPDKGWVIHMLDPPSKPHKIRLAHPPSWFHSPCDEEFRLLEPVYEGGNIPVVGEANVQKEFKTSFSLDTIRKIREANLQKVEESLVNALGAVCLLDQEIKMRVRFGHVCLINWPKDKTKKDNKKDEEDSKGNNKDKKVSRDKDKNNKDKKDEKDKKDKKDEKDDDSSSQMLWSIERFNRYLKHPLMLSKFATHLASEEDQISDLKNILSGSEHSKEWDNSPFREFKIRGIRKIPGSKEKESWPCTFDIQFDKFETDKKKVGEKYNNNEESDNKKYRIGLWNAVLNERNILDINMSCLNNSDYSWKLNIQTAKCLSNNRFHPEGNFVHILRFCPQGRLVYSNTKEIEVESVCEKTKHKYWWNNDYIIEVTKYEYWDLSRYMNTSPGIEILLSREPKPKVSYGVTLYKRSWDEGFAHNRNLKIGEVPEWHPDDFKGTNAMIIDIQNFLKELQTHLPMQTG